MRRLAPGVHVAETPLRFLGLEVGARMTVLELASGLLVHSPIDVAPSSLASIGEPRWVLAPNKMHHLYVGRWAEAGIEAWAAPGLPTKRRDVAFAGVIDSPGSSPFGDEVAVLPLTCFAMTNEVAVLHRPSGTLVLTDLVFNFPPTAPWTTRVGMRCAGAYPGCRASLLEQAGMRRAVARREINLLLGWDFDRVVLAHGDVIERGGKDALRQAYRWLRLDGAGLGE